MPGAEVSDGVNNTWRKPWMCVRSLIVKSQENKIELVTTPDLVPEPTDEVQEEHPKTAQWPREPKGECRSCSGGCSGGRGSSWQRPRARRRWRPGSPLGPNHAPLQPQQSQQSHKQSPPQVTRVLPFDHLDTHTFINRDKWFYRKKTEKMVEGKCCL